MPLAPTTPAAVPFSCLTDDERYETIRRRDPAADGAFYYSVATTGVYCRPNCGARLALRGNVAFHATPQEAEAAGFRPCKRCRPHEMSRADRHTAAVAAARRTIEAGASSRLDDLAVAAGLSRFHFQRVFKSVCGLTPKQYGRVVRSHRVRAELSRAATVTDAIYEAGYASSSRFYAEAASLGMTPTAFRNGGGGVAIHATVRPTSLGPMLVAGTERGVCAVLFGEDEAELQADLRRRFPRARFVDAPSGFESWVAAVAAYVAMPRGVLDLPVDLQGTAFQQRVWSELRKVAAGTTTTYGEIAARIGTPGAVRAVAQACASNPAAVAVPCHRVVRRDGSLSGYRWGLDRKRKLLAREDAQ
jgi:AraC family transcriptional regulator of adaptative response/methylated-DNA-[protein]-cysteine methyltransferase